MKMYTLCSCRKYDAIAYWGEEELCQNCLWERQKELKAEIEQLKLKATRWEKQALRVSKESVARFDDYEGLLRTVRAALAERDAKLEAVREAITDPDYTNFNMDGSIHTLVKETGCCQNEGKLCECGGWMHYQPVYGGYFYECEVCHKTEI